MRSEPRDHPPPSLEGWHFYAWIMAAAGGLFSPGFRFAAIYAILRLTRLTALHLNTEQESL
ncbi:MAG: hypothetical protein K6A68_10830 [Clostridiales bacterium]|nr:hypothetical protein [Clostridiales bacterium]